MSNPAQPSRPSSAMRARTLAASAVLGLSLAGCSGATIAGLHDAPAEVNGSASISSTVAQTAARRSLSTASAALGASSTSGKRAAAFTGPALQAANDRIKYGPTSSSAIVQIEDPRRPKVLAVSEGTGFPRYILAVTQAKRGAQLHTLVAKSAASSYQVFSTVDLAGGAQVPSLGSMTSGTPIVPAKADSQQGRIVRAYASGMAFPQPKKRSSEVSFKDAYSTNLLKKIKERRADLRGQVAIALKHSPRLPNDTVIFKTADGGSLVVTTLNRFETFKAGAKTKEIRMPKKLEELTKKAYRKQAMVTYQESIVLVIPERGRARVIGLREQAMKVTGS